MISYHSASANMDELEKTARLKSPIELAFIGDSVYELLVRDYITRNVDTSPNKLHQLAVKYVKAESQALFIDKLNDILSDEEVAIVKRGRNANKTTVPKHADPRQYRMATGFEALFGYLYLSGKKERIQELFNMIVEIMPVSSLM